MGKQEESLPKAPVPVRSQPQLIILSLQSV